ncbi:hypothetical protein [Nocardia sp. NPDC051832]|uniref:hypothetical protein n=1 Tax=Nocardia sp. NPDC051832 TaxID=3155673 RepID=UPI003429D2DE
MTGHAAESNGAPCCRARTGSIGVIIAAALDNPALLFLALFVHGAGTATNLPTRYAGTGLATAAH